MNKYILAIDQGTSSSRAIIFDKESNIISIAQKEIRSFYPKPGWVQQNADEIWASVVAVIYEALAKRNITLDQISAIGITNQRETTVVWDKRTGEPVHFALVWQSRQTHNLCEEVKERGYQELIQERTGLKLDPYFSASKIRWILDHIENGQQRAEDGELAFGTIDSWLVYKLTGRRVHITDTSNASRTMLMDIKELKWSEELCDIWNIPMKMLPEIRNTSELYGYTHESLFNHQVPITSVVGDQQAALFGQICFKKGMVKNTYGTGCFILMNVGNEYVSSNNGLLTTVGWSINGEVTYALEGSVFVAGAAIQWLRDELNIITDASLSETMATSVEDNGGVYVVPTFVGMGAPHWDAEATGSIYGLTRGSNKNHLVRATLESMAYQTYDVVKAMEKDIGMEISSLQVDGGASKNNFLMQWQSNVLQKDVRRPLIQETTALGAAYLAGLAVGYWNDVSEIKSNWLEDKKFVPVVSKENMLKYISKWEKATEVTKLFK